MKLKTVVLHGGTRNGDSTQVYSFQKILYRKKRISIAESKALQIDDVIAWEPADEVYERQADGSFKYARAVHYKPSDVELNDETDQGQ